MAFCSNCGHKIEKENKFCANCGTSVVKDVSARIQLKCQCCKGIMDFDKDKEVLFCPFCGSKELLPMSDAVKIEQIRNKTARDIELGNQLVERTKQQVYRDVELAKELTKKELEMTKLKIKFMKMIGPTALFLIGVIMFSIYCTGYRWADGFGPMGLLIIIVSFFYGIINAIKK